MSQRDACGFLFPEGALCCVRSKRSFLDLFFSSSRYIRLGIRNWNLCIAEFDRISTEMILSMSIVFWNFRRNLYVNYVSLIDISIHCTFRFFFLTSLSSYKFKFYAYSDCIVSLFSNKICFFFYVSFSVTNFNNRNMRPDNDGV